MLNKLKEILVVVGLLAFSFVLMTILGWACLTLITSELGFAWGLGFFFAWLYATLKIQFPKSGELDEKGFPLVILSFLALCAFCTLIS